jgi:hypothetical protein
MLDLTNAFVMDEVSSLVDFLFLPVKLVAYLLMFHDLNDVTQICSHMYGCFLVSIFG